VKRSNDHINRQIDTQTVEFTDGHVRYDRHFLELVNSRPIRQTSKVRAAILGSPGAAPLSLGHLAPRHRRAAAAPPPRGECDCAGHAIPLKD